MDLSSVDWAAVGSTIGTGLLAAGAALAGARRSWRKGLGEMLRPVVQKEVTRAMRTSAVALREDVRGVVGEETAPLREEMRKLRERAARTEGAVEALMSSNRDSSTRGVPHGEDEEEH